MLERSVKRTAISGQRAEVRGRRGEGGRIIGDDVRRLKSKTRTPKPARRAGQRNQSPLATPPTTEKMAAPRTLRRRSAEAVLEKLAAQIRVCTRCPLCKSRTLAVPGEGKATAPVMIIGEGPGSQEDKTGRPFVNKETFAFSAGPRWPKRRVKLTRDLSP